LSRQRPASSPVPATVLAIDPGRFKCGTAVVRLAVQEDAPDRLTVLHHDITGAEHLVARALHLITAHNVTIVLIGDATNGKALARSLREALPEQVPIEMVPEAFTSQRARTRYCQENPPAGWRRLLPTGLRTPPYPYDDYVAVLLAEDWFAARDAASVSS
jgi:hypothetical protein